METWTIAGIVIAGIFLVLLGYVVSSRVAFRQVDLDRATDGIRKNLLEEAEAARVLLRKELQEERKEFKGQIKHLQDEVRGLQKDIIALQQETIDKVAALQKDLQKAAEEAMNKDEGLWRQLRLNENMGEEIAGLRAENAELRENITELRKQVAKLIESRREGAGGEK